MGRRGKTRNPAERLRFAVEALPARTKEAMLRGIDSNRIIVGAYVDPRSGGICPMLAAHRNGGRTSLASFARSWDCYTGAKHPRLATRREIRTLRALLEASLAREIGDDASLAEVAARIRAERAGVAAREASQGPGDRQAGRRHAPDTDERHRARELRGHPRWAWLRPALRYDEFKDLLAAAEEQLSERRAAEVLGERPAERLHQR